MSGLSLSGFENKPNHRAISTHKKINFFGSLLTKTKSEKTGFNHNFFNEQADTRYLPAHHYGENVHNIRLRPHGRRCDA